MKVIIILTLCIVLLAGKDLRDFFPSCQNEPDIETCLLNALDSVRPRFRHGISDMGVPPLDPYNLDYLDIDTELPNIKVKCTVTNLYMYGASNYRIPYFRIDNRTFAFEMKVVLPYLTVTADYDTQGTKVFFVKLNGHGHFKGIFNGITVTIRGLMQPIIRPDDESLVIDTLSTQINFGHSDLTIKPLTNSFASRVAAAYINARPAAIMETLAPRLDEYVAPKLKEYLNTLLQAISSDRLVIFRK